MQSTGITQSGQLDMATIQKAYHESEFDWVKMVLESYLKKGNSVTRDEKTFAYKYLGVIYASEATAQNRAESYFNMLLNLSPDIELTDMYAPKSIEELFHDVKKDFISKREYDKTHDAFGRPLQTHPTTNDTRPQSASASHSNTSSNVREEKSNHAWVWWGTGIVAVGFGVGMYLWMQRAPESGTETETLSGGL
ncbi:MAG: hypothetical protein ABIW76_06205 [Fibrobacteria bacterium]